jgi:hypothetical protein
MRFILFLSLFMGSLVTQAQGLAQKNTIDALGYMSTVYSTVYAPAPWKKEFANWDVESQYRASLAQVEQKGSNLTTDDARRILMDFVYSMRDYHVSIRFFSTEEASLPFTVRGAEGRFFIVDIERDKLGPEIFPFNVGDEIVTFGGRPVAEEVADLRAVTAENVASTDQARAELNLTLRRKARGLQVPQGAVTLGIRRKGASDVADVQLVWKYQAEEILPLRTNHVAATLQQNPSLIREWNMTTDHGVTNANNHGLGARKSYLPAFGDMIWESSDQDAFHAYIYRADDGKMIGVIRVPSYSLPATPGRDVYADAVASFSRLINHMQRFTDKLVIDQLNNPGGSVFYLYALASVLSPNTLARHTMSVTPADVANCVNVSRQLSAIKNDAEAKAMLGTTISGYPVTLQFVEFYKNFCRTYLEDWKAGQSMSRPFWIAGVDRLNPYPGGTYTKPIMVLVNELDFSGGDFFPTILQDNQRAKIFGTRTAGAGGYVSDYTFPNLVGIEAFRVTESLAHRVSLNPIENLGVTPDISYEMTAVDRQNNYSEYVKAVKAALKDL